jgi:hypothetical protein
MTSDFMTLGWALGRAAMTFSKFQIIIYAESVYVVFNLKIFIDIIALRIKILNNKKLFFNNYVS